MSSAPSPTRHPARTGPGLIAALSADALVVVLFVAIGRASHGDGGLAGYAGTLWPFLVGLLTGWLTGLLLPRTRPLLLHGLVVAVSTAVIGVLLRAVAADGGLQPGFVITSLLFITAGMLGWRLVFLGVTRLRRGPASAARRP